MGDTRGLGGTEAYGRASLSVYAVPQAGHGEHGSVSRQCGSTGRAGQAGCVRQRQDAGRQGAGWSRLHRALPPC